jgi:hypothetical protein
MINAENIEAAERVLSIMNDQGTREMDPQMSALQVDGDAYAHFLENRMILLKRHLKVINAAHEPALNTMLTHFFLIGLIAGRGVKSL